MVEDPNNRLTNLWVYCNKLSIHIWKSPGVDIDYKNNERLEDIISQINYSGKKHTETNGYAFGTIRHDRMNKYHFSWLSGNTSGVSG